jgi:hypothetical protein
VVSPPVVDARKKLRRRAEAAQSSATCTIPLTRSYRTTSESSRAKYGWYARDAARCPHYPQAALSILPLKVLSSILFGTQCSLARAVSQEAVINSFNRGPDAVFAGVDTSLPSTCLPCAPCASRCVMRHGDSDKRDYSRRFDDASLGSENVVTILRSARTPGRKHSNVA